MTAAPASSVQTTSNPVVVPPPIPEKNPPNSFPSFPRSTSFFSFSVVPLTVWFLGSAMFLINVSFVVIYSLSALYLNSVVGVSTRWIGLLEGVVEAVSYLMKLFSGVLSDYLRRRKIIMVIGYAMMVISKPLLAVSNSFGIVFAARFFERLGNGIQATPRDAMVSDVAPAGHKGASFGLMRSLGVAGSFLGGILAVFAMWYTGDQFQTVFWLTTIPATCAILLLMFAVKEPEHKIHPRDIKDKKGRHPLHLSDLKRLGKEYWLLMFVVGIFMLARVSETLIVLHAHKTFEFPKTYAPIIMTIYNLTYCLSSYPVGLLSDKIGRYGLLGVASAVLMLADFLLSFATNIYMVLIGALIWGIQMGMAQNLFVSLIADIVPEDLRGTGFGFYYLVGALASVLAGFGGGHIAEAYSVAHTFFASMVVAGLSLGVLFIFLKLTNKRGFSPAKS